MRWFNKAQSRDIWDEPVPAPLGDIEAAERIRTICRSATTSAEWVGGAAGRGESAAAKKHEAKSARYRRAARAAMKIAMTVSDELMRDAAVREIVELCLKAQDMKTARVLFRAIQSPTIRDGALREHPDLVA
ncbi:MAG: hypothetical protein JOZ74_15355 [Bradyrhizobium sp.]|nr:hypothetical protein [Bradyrhizobium sp.]